MFLLKISWVIPLLVLVLILLLWWLWKWYQAQQFLARLPTTTSPDIRELFIKGIDDKIFQSVSLARTAQRLRQHISSKSPNSLDIEATIEKSIQAAGWFTPVSGTIKNRPEYLVLIDRTTFNDHHHELINHSIIKQLDDQNVIIKSYYFDEVPLRFYSEQSQEPPLTLTELAQTYPEHRLMIFSDGNGLINPITLKTVNWIEQFSVWSKRTLFTLETPDQWGYREHILEEANFLILPANENGLKRLIERLHSGTWKPYPKPPYSSYNQFPKYIQERPRRWLEHHAPDTPVLKELLKQIQDFLGVDAYQWFSACAVYPELRWQLTLYLGEHLKSLTEEGLAKLARLPWFRYGYMPDWLREQLIKDLSLVQERKIRTALYRLLLKTSEKPSYFDLEIAKHNLKIHLKNGQQKSPLHEHVFMTFMGDKLSVKISKILRLLLKVNAKLPSMLSLLWLTLMQPITLHNTLKACGIENPDVSIFKLWFTKDETGSIKRQYVKQFLLLLFVVIPILSSAITYIFFISMLDFSINFSNWVAFLIGGVVGGVVGGMIGSVTEGVAVGLLGCVVGSVTGGVAVDLARYIPVDVVVSVAVSVAVISVTGGVPVSVAVGVAVGVSVGLAVGLAVGVVVGVAVGMAVGIARMISKRITGGVVENFTGALLCVLVGNLIFIDIISISSKTGLPSDHEFIKVLIFISLIFMLSYLRLLLSPIEALWQIICYTIQKTTNLSTLRFVPVLYHNLSFLPHPFLLKHIMLGAKTEPDLAKKVIDACIFSPGQHRVG